ncbi:hypothetical protein WK41_28430 [Burkholderia cepacia]|nr:hypothetical protein WK41_28430 [Burkholderia cepacia]
MNSPRQILRSHKCAEAVKADAIALCLFPGQGGPEHLQTIVQCLPLLRSLITRCLDLLIAQHSRYNHVEEQIIVVLKL